uniref:Uncharacterized protein n=1 Tax=Mycena chlorophos TaxID=658473 RepID=A0ABQ0M6R2_MYCCL|nr:predicted protein [Mycena chlorophos]
MSKSEPKLASFLRYSANSFDSGSFPVSRLAFSLWGYAKRLYRLKPESSKEDKLEENTLDALANVPLIFMRKYVTRAHRFGDGYLRGLTGTQAAWAAKRFHGHRVFPESILEMLDKEGIV